MRFMIGEEVLIVSSGQIGKVVSYRYEVDSKGEKHLYFVRYGNYSTSMFNENMLERTSEFNNELEISMIDILIDNQLLIYHKHNNANTLQIIKQLVKRKNNLMKGEIK